MITQSIRDSRLPKLDLLNIIADFRDHVRRTEALKQSYSRSDFATLQGENQEGEKEREYTCICDGKHRYEKCYYVTPSTRLPGWNGKPETFDKINKKLTSLKPIRGVSRKDIFESRYKYDGFKRALSTTTTT